MDKNVTLIDGTDLGFKLGYGKEILTEDEKTIRSVKIPENALLKVYKIIREKEIDGETIQISGVRENYVLCGICKELKSRGIKNINKR